MGKLSRDVNKVLLKNQRIKDNLARVEYLLYDSNMDLTDGNIEFLESIERRLKSETPLTDGQENYLADIEEKEFI